MRTGCACGACKLLLALLRRSMCEPADRFQCTSVLLLDDFTFLA